MRSAGNELNINTEFSEIQKLAEKSLEPKKLYLHYAVVKQDLDLVNYFIENGESALKKDKNGVTPLMIAAAERYGKGYDIFLVLVKRAQEEIRNYRDNKQYPDLITQTEKVFAKPLLENLEEYSHEVGNRSNVKKFFSVMFGMDETLERNLEQAEAYETFYNAFMSKDYYTLYRMLDRNWYPENNTLHRSMEHSKAIGKKIFPDYDSIVKHREVVEEVRKNQPLSLNQTLIRKLNTALQDNQELRKTNESLKEILNSQKTEIEDLKLKNLEYDKKFEDMQKLIVTIHKTERPVKKEHVPKSRVVEESSFLSWPMFNFASEEKPVNNKPVHQSAIRVNKK